MKVVSFQYSYGFCVGDRTDKISKLRWLSGFCDKSAICETSSNEHVDGRHKPSRIVRG